DAGQARQDLEGMQTMRVLGRTMAWMLKCIEAGKNAGVPFPENEQRIWTNFIR
ncbi:MAG: flavodoxin family protein, partial [Lachnospiraceae bacterium]|nr:flavodoxin family protein [Lachnospiraceae bacterium]